MSRVVKSYYIGDPTAPNKRGQDEYYVYCLVWGLIYANASAKKGHAVGIGGGGIGNAKTIPKARAMIHAYAVESIAEEKAKAKDTIQRCDAALKALGDDPANVEQFVGEYMERSAK